MAPNLTGAQSSTQAIFALDIITAAIALTLLGLATRPTLKRIKARKFTVRNKDTGSPLKTTLGTYLFLYPALFFLFIAYLFRFINDLLKTSGPGIDYDGDLQLHGRRPTQNDTGYDYSIAVLSFAADMASIFYTTLLNGGVWIYANHVTSNGTNLARQDWKSKIWNTFIMFSILGTGLAAWGLAIAARRHADWYSAMVESDHTTRIVHIVYRAVVVAASLSVSVEVLRRYAFVRKLSSKSVCFCNRPLSQDSFTDPSTDQRAPSPGSLRHRGRSVDMAAEYFHHLRHRPHFLQLFSLESDFSTGKLIPLDHIRTICRRDDLRHDLVRGLDERAYGRHLWRVDSHTLGQSII